MPSEIKRRSDGSLSSSAIALRAICSAFGLAAPVLGASAYQTFGKGVVWSWNLAMAVLIKRSIEGGIGLYEGLLVGACGDGASRMMGFEDFGKLSCDVLIIAFRLQQRECLPAAQPKLPSVYRAYPQRFDALYSGNNFFIRLEFT
jgi:hypothetical protein